MKKVTKARLEKATNLIRKMVADGNSFVYSKTIASRQFEIPWNKIKEFQKLESYQALKNEFVLKNREAKRYIKAAL